ncbi:MEMO1 family [Crepidotus variabilis]|uniref:MEMO1 family n=1 Tax=Crepidotus variabilis TaxID=179855 RepID=A0A9P6JTN9_9AGAR|nr:MEMO1 family [Crepidotus variabilis]
MWLTIFNAFRSSRDASHAGSWYTDDGKKLNTELESFLAKVEGTEEPYPIQRCKAVIAPHAGYSYSGPAAAWAYKSIDTTGIKRVFILGPSHHYYLEGCALSRCTNYKTPIGDLPLDADTIKELKDTGHFQTMTVSQDEDEHSIEMHLPYVRKIFEGRDIKIVPVLVGSIKKEREAFFGDVLAPYLAAEDTFFVTSSDFCHWGTRFDYTFYYPSSTSDASEPKAGGYNLTRSQGPSPSYEIHESISRLDHEAMDILTVPPSTFGEAHNKFAEYLNRTRNTICGRHPIGVLFGALASLEKGEADVRPTIKWVRYEQSSQCKGLRDSSVSYASAYVKF